MCVQKVIVTTQCIMYMYTVYTMNFCDNLQHKVIICTCMYTGSIAECIRQRLPSAEVTGVNSEDEMVLALSSVPPPISFNGEHLRGLGVPTNRPLGCFIRGAGIYVHYITYT